ncbi:hypothetical protein QBC47DRAFT_414664 [Echria macrotheca]|uniref:Extracellular membrane protein CFEM domain-containing protein n=1 Tax=Echria macrotheca TaxID=438768 RepID=A0AAJ0BCT8_9PEZI|nr:hypothetical protein QBC47DRAFT_414664 [Echria macrotheca]
MENMTSRLGRGLSRLSSPLLLLHLLLLQLLVQIVAAQEATVTITDFPGYSSQRTCAQKCLCNGNCVQNMYFAPFGCPVPLGNDCFCRRDLMSSAAKSISSCISIGCSANQVDIASATSIYAAYCAQNGYSPAVATAGGGGGGGGGGFIAATPALGAGGAGPTASTGDINNNGNAGNGGNGCGNQVANVSGVNIVCGSKSGAGLAAADVRLLAVGLTAGLGVAAWAFLV